MFFLIPLNRVMKNCFTIGTYLIITFSSPNSNLFIDPNII